MSFLKPLFSKETFFKSLLCHFRKLFFPFLAFILVNQYPVPFLVNKMRNSYYPTHASCVSYAVRKMSCLLSRTDSASLKYREEVTYISWRITKLLSHVFVEQKPDPPPSRQFWIMTCCDFILRDDDLLYPLFLPNFLDDKKGVDRSSTVIARDGTEGTYVPSTKTGWGMKEWEKYIKHTHDTYCTKVQLGLQQAGAVGMYPRCQLPLRLEHTFIAMIFLLGLAGNEWRRTVSCRKEAGVHAFRSVWQCSAVLRGPLHAAMYDKC